MNSDHYVAMLEEKIPRFMDILAPRHPSTTGCNAIPARRRGGNSPNPNLIENLWSVMKKKLKDDHTITSLKDCRMPSQG
jgi:hypothetical protein